jgi:hypothetical protein
MSSEIPPSSNIQKQPSQPSEHEAKKKWFSTAERDKLIPIVQKILFKKDETASINKAGEMLDQLEIYLIDKELPEKYKKTALHHFFRLGQLEPEQRSRVIAEIERQGIQNITQKDLSNLIEREKSEKSEKRSISPSHKRSQKDRTPSPPEPLTQPQSGFLEKRVRKETEKEKEVVEEISVIKEAKEEKPLPSQPAASPLTQATEKDFEEIFKKFFTPESKLRNYSWERLKKEVLTLGDPKKCKEKSFVHEACWYYLHIQDQKRLNVLWEHIKNLSKVSPYSIMITAKTIQETTSLEFNILLKGLLALSITESNTINSIQSLYKKHQLGLDKQESVLKIIGLLNQYSIFENPKGVELFELTLIDILPWLADEKSFSFALWILKCTLKNSSSSPQTRAEAVMAAFKKIGENQGEIFKRYNVANPIEIEIYKRVIESQLLTTSIQQIDNFIKEAKTRFTREKVSKMMSESIFKKHLCENLDPNVAKKVTRERLTDPSLALSNGASVLMGKKEELIDGLVEALQANILYIIQLEEFAGGKEKVAKWPVERPTPQGLPFPHLVNLLHEFETDKSNSFVHQQSLKMPASVQIWNALEFGVIIKNQKIEIVHCCPMHSPKKH